MQLRIWPPHFFVPREDYDILSYASSLYATSNMGKAKKDKAKDSTQAAREEEVNADIRSPQGFSNELENEKRKSL